MIQIPFQDEPLRIGVFNFDATVSGRVLVEDGLIMEIIIDGHPDVVARRHGPAHLTVERAIWTAMRDALYARLQEQIAATELVERDPYGEWRHSMRERL